MQGHIFSAPWTMLRKMQWTKMRRAMMGAVAVFVMGAFLSTFCVYGQNVTGAIVGTATDTTGAAIPGATVTITNEAKGVVRTFQTDAGGYYSAPKLTPGSYTVSVSKAGFTTAKRTGVVLFVNTTARVDATMTPGEVTQTVTVSSATAPMLQTDTADTGRQIDTRQVSQLPLGSAHNFQNLLNTVPGAGVAAAEHSTFFNPQGSLASTVNGNSSLNNDFDIEGIDDNQRTDMLQIYIPPAEAIQEVNITTSNYDPQQGAALGAVTNVILKSGTNNFHGEVFEFYSGNALNTRSYFQQPNGGPFHYPHIVDNYFGGNIGGPIQRGKTFFFVSYVEHRQRTGATYTLSVPNADIRGGDFSTLAAAAGTDIYDPTTGDTADCLPGGNSALCGTGRTKFPGNIIPTNRLNPIALKLLAFVPLPNSKQSAGGVLPYQNNLITSSSFHQDTPDLDVKIDHFFGENDHLSGRFSYENPQLNQPGIFGDGGEAGGPVQSGQEGYGHNKTFSTGVNWVHGFSPTLLTEFRAGLSRFDNAAFGAGYGKALSTQVGIPGANMSDFTSGLTAINGVGFSGPMVGVFGSFPWVRAGTILEFFNNWAKVKGNHTFEWGIDYHRVRDDLLLVAQPAGSFNFGSGPTALNVANLPPPAKAPASGFANNFASFLLDTPSSLNRGYANVFPAYRQNQTFAYGGDKWQVTPALTLTMGLRWEYYAPPTPHFAGGFSNYNPDTNNLELAGIGDVPRNLGSQRNWRNFSPRLGVAYRISPKSVVRTGFGMSYMSFPIDLYAYNYPLEPTQSYNNLSSFGPGLLSDGSASTFEQGIPALPAYVAPANGLIPATGFLLSQSYTAINLKWTNPYVMSWNLAYERDLPGKWVIDVAYVGNRAVHTPLENNLNAATSYGSTSKGQPEFVKFGRTASTTIYFQGYSNNYNALQVKFDHRFSNGFSVTTAYTYSKAIGFETQSGAYVSGLQDYVNPNRNYAVTDFNQTHILNNSFTWNLPMGTGHALLGNGLTGKIFGGFELSGISGFTTGTPLGFSCSACTSFNTPGSTAFPSMNGKLHKLYGIQDKPWFATTSFYTPAPGTQGNVGTRISHGPDFYNLDASLFRKLKLSERFGLELRTEWFHATNTPQFSNPNTSWGSSSFGLVSGAGGARNIDLAGKLTF